jgi:AraC-like DNA-binding protein
VRFSKQPEASLHDWRKIRPELVFIFDEPVPADRINGKAVRRNEFSAWLVRRGWVFLKADGVCRRCEKGEWLISFGRNIEQEFSSDAHLLSLRIVQSWPEGSALFSGSPLHALSSARYPELEKLAMPLIKAAETGVAWRETGEDPRRSFLWRTRLDYFEYIDYERDLLAWLKELARALVCEGAEMFVPSHQDPRLSGVLHILDSTPPGGSFPQDELVKSGGLTLDRLNHLSVQAYGYTLHAYWEQRRVDWACRMLEQPATQIKTVALELGFLRLPHFSAWFKRHCGASPRAWRERLRKK